MTAAHLGLADPRAYVHLAAMLRQQIADGALITRAACTIAHPPHPRARIRAAHLRQGAADAGMRRAPDPHPRPWLLRD